jgi:flagellar protein FliO/FliZ
MDTLLALKASSALAFVMGLMYLLALGLKRLGLAAPALPGVKRRLRVVESLPLDARRRLVLVRRDQKEHLLVLGPEGETVVETGIPAAPEPDAIPANMAGEALPSRREAK